MPFVSCVNKPPSACLGVVSGCLVDAHTTHVALNRVNVLSIYAQAPAARRRQRQRQRQQTQHAHQVSSSISSDDDDDGDDDDDDAAATDGLTHVQDFTLYCTLKYVQAVPLHDPVTGALLRHVLFLYSVKQEVSLVTFTHNNSSSSNNNDGSGGDGAREASATRDALTMVTLYHSGIDDCLYQSPMGEVSLVCCTTTHGSSASTRTSTSTSLQANAAGSSHNTSGSSNSNNTTTSSSWLPPFVAFGVGRGELFVLDVLAALGTQRRTHHRTRSPLDDVLPASLLAVAEERGQQQRTCFARSTLHSTEYDVRDIAFGPPMLPQLPSPVGNGSSSSSSVAIGNRGHATLASSSTTTVPVGVQQQQPAMAGLTMAAVHNNNNNSTTATTTATATTERVHASGSALSLFVLYGDPHGRTHVAEYAVLTACMHDDGNRQLRNSSSSGGVPSAAAGTASTATSTAALATPMMLLAGVLDRCLSRLIRKGVLQSNVEATASKLLVLHDVGVYVLGRQLVTLLPSSLPALSSTTSLSQQQQQQQQQATSAIVLSQSAAVAATVPRVRRAPVTRELPAMCTASEVACVCAARDRGSSSTSALIVCFCSGVWLRITAATTTTAAAAAVTTTHYDAAIEVYVTALPPLATTPTAAVALTGRRRCVVVASQFADTLLVHMSDDAVTTPSVTAQQQQQQQQRVLLANSGPVLEMTTIRDGPRTSIVASTGVGRSGGLRLVRAAARVTTKLTLPLHTTRVRQVLYAHGLLLLAGEAQCRVFCLDDGQDNNKDGSSGSNSSSGSSRRDSGGVTPQRPRGKRLRSDVTADEAATCDGRREALIEVRVHEHSRNKDEKSSGDAQSGWCATHATTALALHYDAAAQVHVLLHADGITYMRLRTSSASSSPSSLLRGGGEDGGRAVHTSTLVAPAAVDVEDDNNNDNDVSCRVDAVHAYRVADVLPHLSQDDEHATTTATTARAAVRCVPQPVLLFADACDTFYLVSNGTHIATLLPCSNDTNNNSSARSGGAAAAKALLPSLRVHRVHAVACLSALRIVSSCSYVYGTWYGDLVVCDAQTQTSLASVALPSPVRSICVAQRTRARQCDDDDDDDVMTASCGIAVAASAHDADARHDNDEDEEAAVRTSSDHSYDAVRAWSRLRLLAGTLDGHVAEATLHSLRARRLLRYTWVKHGPVELYPLHTAPHADGGSGSEAFLCYGDVPLMLLCDDDALHITGLTLPGVTECAALHTRTPHAVDDSEHGTRDTRQRLYAFVSRAHHNTLYVGSVGPAQRVSERFLPLHRTVTRVTHVPRWDGFVAALRQSERDVVVYVPYAAIESPWQVAMSAPHTADNDNDNNTGGGGGDDAAVDDTSTAAAAAAAAVCAHGAELLENERCVFIEPLCLGGANECDLRHTRAAVTRSNNNNNHNNNNSSSSDGDKDDDDGDDDATASFVVLVGSTFAFPDEQLSRSSRVMWYARDTAASARATHGRLRLLGSKDVLGMLQCCCVVPHYRGRIALGVSGCVVLYHWSAVDGSFVVEDRCRVGFALTRLVPIFASPGGDGDKGSGDGAVVSGGSRLPLLQQLQQQQQHRRHVAHRATQQQQHNGDNDDDDEEGESATTRQRPRHAEAATAATTSGHDSTAVDAAAEHSHVSNNNNNSSGGGGGGSGALSQLIALDARYSALFLVVDTLQGNVRVQGREAQVRSVMDGVALSPSRVALFDTTMNFCTLRNEARHGGTPHADTAGAEPIVHHRLVVEAQFHIGDYVTCVQPGSLAVTTASASLQQPQRPRHGDAVDDGVAVDAAVPTSRALVAGLAGTQLLYGTAHGSFGTLTPVGEVTYLVLRALERAVVAVAGGYGGFAAAAFREVLREGAERGAHHNVSFALNALNKTSMLRATAAAQRARNVCDGGVVARYRVLRHAARQRVLHTASLLTANVLAARLGGSAQQQQRQSPPPLLDVDEALSSPALRLWPLSELGDAVERGNELLAREALPLLPYKDVDVCDFLHRLQRIC